MRRRKEQEKRKGKLNTRKESHQPSGRQVVSGLRDSIHPSNSFIQFLEEGFTPPPTSSPGLKIVVPNAAVASYIQLFRHPGYNHFS